MIIPYEELRPDTLESIIEDYVTRQGAVHGHRETPLSEMVHDIMTQLRSGKVVIMFDQAEETCGIFTAQAAQRIGSAGPRDIEDEPAPTQPDD